ncbi:MAG TPA: type II toxin-antitoxin system prevent-host-death family antitoxin [bacterium]|nr:type II toxin-antitoxin system prevent-host-death family antitoxin [bacterium]HQO33874.1 type II toxin-antitoxin system prevent-host-death family antitoxin [bacterium]HQP98117.1 type II toxin-antitoxin system prevent-host-death family antitoxin [bacterium]
MKTIGSHEAQTHLAKLLKQVSQGEEITITRRGVPIARLVPVDKINRDDVRKAVEEIRSLRKGLTLGGLSIGEMINAGRKY